MAGQEAPVVTFSCPGVLLPSREVAEEEEAETAVQKESQMSAGESVWRKAEKSVGKSTAFLIIQPKDARDGISGKSVRTHLHSVTDTALNSP